MKELLKKLCLINGVSGDECDVREFIISQVENLCEYRIDNLGNLICFKKGRKAPDKKIMIAAHMDEVGFIVTSIRDDGTLTFGAVGGIEPVVAVGRQVIVGKNNLSGVIGSTAVHNLSAEQRDKAPKMDSLYIDIGASDKADAEKYVCGIRRKLH